MSTTLDQLSAYELAGRHRRDLVATPPLEDEGRGGLARSRSLYSDPALWVAVVVVAGVSGALSIPRYLRLEPATWDLGIFTEAIRGYSNLKAPIVDIKGPGFNLLGDHFHPLIAVIAPIFRLFPSAITLLVAQAILTSVSVVPVYIASAETLGIAKARVISLAYGLSWGLAAMNSYDFHEICLAVPLLAFALSALVRGKITSASLWALPLVLVKEDQGLTVAAIGVVIALTHSSRWRTGVLLAYVGIASSIIEVYILIPHFNAAHTYPYWADSGGLASLGIGLGVKVPTVILTLLPTAFMALRSPIAAVAVPGVLLRFASPNNLFWGTGQHYSATIMPIVFLAATDGIYRAMTGTKSGRLSSLTKSLAVHAPAMMGATCVALAFQSPLTSLWTANSYRISERARSADRAMSIIPRGTTVESSLNELAPLAARDDVYWWSDKAPQWILFDETSPEWKVTPTFIATRHSDVSYHVVFDGNGIWLFERSD
jgi:uncharacterized membrane protein